MNYRTVWLLAWFAVSSGHSLRAEDPAQKPGRLDVQVRAQMNYLIALPKDYEQQEKWPLLLFLHGSGERGDDLEQVKFHGPPKLIAAGKEFPMIVVSPQCPKGRAWEPIELIALLDDLQQRYKVDADRVYLTGLSMGAYGSWRLAWFAPNRFAAIAPICGGGEVFWAKHFKHVPVWAFHNALDPGEPVERTLAMIRGLKEAGAEPKLTIYPDAKHDAWTETYNNPDFYEWLLQQKRQPKAE